MSQRLVVAGLQDPSITEFLQNPDFRQIATFFLGWVFLYSLQLITSSKTLHAFLSFDRLLSRSRSRHATPDLEAHISRAPNTPAVEKTPTFYNTFARNQSANQGHAFILTLALCFASASLAHFVSLLDFSTRNGETACAFAVVWGGLAGQAARLVGLLILGQELRRLGLHYYETSIFYVVLCGTLGLIFANNAIGIGTLRYVPQLGVSICYKRHFMPTGLGSTCLLIALEIYVVWRTLTFISLPFSSRGHRVEIMTDFRIVQASSLLLLDVLTIPSNVIPPCLLVDFVPFSIGALIVLVAFAVPVKPDEVDPPKPIPTAPNPSLHSSPAASGSMASIRTIPGGQPCSGVNSQNSVNTSGPVPGHVYTPTNNQPSPAAAGTTQTPLNPSVPWSPLLRRDLPPLQNPPTASLPKLPVESPVILSFCQILPDQAKYAERLEQKQSLPPGPSWKKPPRPTVSIVITDDRQGPPVESPAPPTSTILGSDIIRSNFVEQANSTSATTDSVQLSHDGTIISAFSPISRDSHSSPRVSFIGPYSLQPSRETLEIMYDHNMTEQGRLRPMSWKMSLGERRNTFGSRPPSLKRPPLEMSVLPPIPDLPPLAFPPGLSHRVRHPSTPIGPRPISESQRP